MSSYLVTGGAGFIGSNIVEELLKRGESVRVLDNLSTGKQENLEFMKKERQSSLNYELIEGDIRDPDACRRACQGMDYVLHQAALRSVPRSVDNPSATNEVNVAGTLNILIAARESGVKRVVYASSSSVYGDSQKLPQKESQAPSPISPYAVSKLAGEYYCTVFSKIYGLETVSLRYFNVFGPRQDPRSQYAAVIPLFIRLALEGKPLEIHGDGLQSRDFTYVSNVVEANLLAAKAANASGEVINVACGETHTVMDIADSISRIIGKKLEYQHTPPRKGDVRKTHADISKAKRLLGYENRVGFDNGLKMTVDYIMSSFRHGK
jgi:nucleoside-diphosphate-sugar epimerase